MRTPALASMALAALLLAGCSGGDPAPTAAGPTPAVAGSAAATTEKPTDTALAEDTEAICAQASRTSTSFGTTFAEDYQLLIKAAAEGAEAKAKAREKVTRDVENFSFALLDMSKLASDAELKKALAAMGAQITALKGDVAKIDDKKLAALHATLDKACGRG
ncbi:PBP1b-binding outer membrane lipoprotein LpoB [Actinoplanes campanulatus]|uniref:PBP1b-binding outer membrane lipoprotein LpoB n=1 Tax=Actinoplanes campanulatus TaxID=113559 RepID=A0A7W5AQM3_9ACTN|nr:hypothetical protein [Actinoplanes campanulatus]MBB3100109.1 PBP1b-binding outer membrane lipoprotein LpoB [Actinoplanes campanulatus]GGN28273.1 hypothetical protein GCM10010109_46440 [Actinoplanes campanulatus]GID39079.1 hypothetical protein Aca09nite_55850 [Actinoplanes campanulatus]